MVGEDVRIKGFVSYSIDQGLLIIDDLNSTFGHDEWDPAAEFISVGADSVYLSVRPSVDGRIEIVIAGPGVAVDGIDTIYYDGVIKLPSKMAVIHDANDVMRFSMRRPAGESHVRVLVDRPGLVARMLVIFMT